eukprot:TRINITY_DN12738_c0_g1_i4.p1 TRINITY_DN12738_c0_g1~~TRINITY_DN12738_c0_g1_i4.p1  ORF type:complete len:403 (-),score=77.63 TRINITY_DN12738_c0_g1_i4:207-1388(-)
MFSKPLLCRGLSMANTMAGLKMSQRLTHSIPAAHIKVNKWNRAVSEAEKLVGYPTSYETLKALMIDDLTPMAVHFRKLIGSDHPVLKTAKRLLYHGKNNMQVRGVLILLLCRAAGSKAAEDAEFDPNTGILNDQRKLSEIVEMIHSAQCIHQSVVNVPVNISKEPDPEMRSVLYQLEYGNKIAILSGDYLLANACTGLAAFRIPKVVELISQAIIEFTQAEFLGKQDPQGKVVPTTEDLDQTNWETRWKLSSGSLLGAGCESAMLLANQSENLQKAAKNLGTHTALAIQAYDEVKMFSSEGNIGSGGQFPLCSAPVLFHLQQDSELLEYIQGFQEDLIKADYKKIFDAVLSGEGLEKTRELSNHHVHTSLEYLREFPDNDGRQAFENLLHALL